MEFITVVGRKHVDFIDDKGKAVKGWSLYYTRQDDRTDGLMAGKMFISDERAANMDIPAPNTRVEVHYDRYGRPAKFVTVK